MIDAALPHLKKVDHSILARADRIGKIPWFAHLSHRQAVSLAGYTGFYETEPGSTILHEGGDDGCMLLVDSGRVEILKSESDAGMKPVATIGPGQSFGEMSLIDGQPRSASAVAVTQVSLLMLSREDFTHLSEEDPSLGVALLFRVAHVMSQHLRKTTGRLVELL